MSVNTELSALLTKMGGTPLESDSNSDLIKKISNAYEGGGGSGGVSSYNDLTDRPFDVTNEYDTLFQETIIFDQDQAAEPLAYSGTIDDDMIEVTFDGVQYSCAKHVNNDDIVYGGIGPEGFDFSDYPFALASMPEGNILVAETQGSHTIKVDGHVETLSTTQDFDKAVVSTAYCILNAVIVRDESAALKRLDKTASEIMEMASHLPVFICDSTESIVGYNNIIWCPCRIRCSSDDESYSFEIASSWSASFADMHFTADSPNAYPILRQEE